MMSDGIQRSGARRFAVGCATCSSDVREVEVLPHSGQVQTTSPPATEKMGMSALQSRQCMLTPLRSR